jgi:cellulose synthase/poly-beta-1,6-N-acetylglucosamine synthase-like glycosyltransferase
MFYLLLTVGLIGLIGMTWLFPCLAGIYCYFSRNWRSGKEVAHLESETRAISVLIPAHNEESSLGLTLASVTESIAAARAKFPTITFNIRVGVDGCTDHTDQIARQFGCDVVVSQVSRGKWKTIQLLVERSVDSEYVILADAGIVWPLDFISQSVEKLSSAKLIALAPTYRNPSMGPIESLLWTFERSLKDLEAHSGGPVSVHGATIIYQTRALTEAFQKLGQHSWLNDDVVIPLVMRALNPSGRLLYCPEIGVADSSQAVAGCFSGSEYGRRRRMVVGNVQWIRRILPLLWQSSVEVGLLSLRRVFRVFWAYWGLAFAAALAMIFIQAFGFQTISILSAIFILVAVIASQRIGAIRRIFDAARASLMAPYYFFTLSRSQEAVWD